MHYILDCTASLHFCCYENVKSKRRIFKEVGYNLQVTNTNKISHTFPETIFS